MRGEGWLRKAVGRSKHVFEAGLQSARLMQIINQPSFMEYGDRRLNVDMQRYLFTISVVPATIYIVQPYHLPSKVR